MVEHGEHCKQGINSIVNGRETFQILRDLTSILHSPFARKSIIQEENILCHLWWDIQTHVSTKLEDRIEQHRRHISCDSTFSSNDQPFQLFTFVIFDHHCNGWITTRNKEINDWMDGCPLDHMTSISKPWIPSSFISYSVIVKLKSI
jgi:hypothetical protein